MIELIIYMAGIIIMMIAFAIRTENADIVPVILLSVFWPISIVAMISIKCLWTINWDFDIVDTEYKWPHYRKPNNPEVRGFAINLFKLEFQFWQKRKI